MKINTQTAEPAKSVADELDDIRCKVVRLHGVAFNLGLDWKAEGRDPRDAYVHANRQLLVELCGDIERLKRKLSTKATQ